MCKLCRSPSCLRNLALCLVAGVFFITLFGNLETVSRAVSDDLRIDSAAALCPQLNASLQPQLIPKAVKLKKSIHSERPTDSTARQGSFHDNHGLIANLYKPVVLSPKNNHQAFLLLDRPPPPRS